jgi:hypothetical protein
MTRLERVDLLEVDLSSVPAHRLLNLFNSIPEVNLQKRRLFSIEKG